MAQKSPIQRFFLILAGLVLGVIAVEVALRVAGLPRFYDSPIELTPRFGILQAPATNQTPLWINFPGAAVRFRYDGNPRGYFDENNELAHFTNKSGFRGGEFETSKPADTIRIAFLGDSFTFGEGVRFEHTYPERAAALLKDDIAARDMRVESYNFGVGGYNTTQSLHALEKWGLLCRPDIVVLGFTLNDAEESLYEMNPATGRPERRNRESDIPESLDDPRPPDNLLYKSAIARFLWRYRAGRERARRIISFYQELYGPEKRGWRECSMSLAGIADICRQRSIPFTVLLFPGLVGLDHRYPFDYAHDRVRREAESVNAMFVDLLPDLEGRRDADLWVHPADQHPNEIVHDVAARALVRRLNASGVIERIVSERRAKYPR